MLSCSQQPRQHSFAKKKNRRDSLGEHCPHGRGGLWTSHLAHATPLTLTAMATPARDPGASPHRSCSSTVAACRPTAQEHTGVQVWVVNGLHEALLTCCIAPSMSSVIKLFNEASADWARCKYCCTSSVAVMFFETSCRRANWTADALQLNEINLFILFIVKLFARLN